LSDCCDDSAIGLFVFPFRIGDDELTIRSTTKKKKKKKKKKKARAAPKAAPATRRITGATQRPETTRKWYFKFSRSLS
jgi:hypothetical protein